VCVLVSSVRLHHINTCIRFDVVSPTEGIARGDVGSMVSFLLLKVEQASLEFGYFVLNIHNILFETFDRIFV
jgi:hypothetical protein